MENNIVMITDEGYVLPTIVALSSMKVNLAKNIYHVYLLVDNISAESRSLFKKIETDYFKLSIIDVDSSSYNGVEKSYSNVTKASLLKFSIPTYLRSVEKALYIDGDVIVRGDLSVLFKIELDDKYAVVISDGPKTTVDGGKQHAFYGDPDYFNSGVMLLNLQKMRKDNISSKLIDYRLHGYNYFMDQDAFNIILGKNVIHVGVEYDFMLHLISYKNEGFSLQQLISFYKLKNYNTIDELFEHVVILHYTFDKPWKYYDIPFNEEWMAYFKQSPMSYKKLDRKSYMSEMYLSKPFTIGRWIADITRPLRKLKK